MGVAGVEQVAVLGAGTMGCGIAHVAALAGYPVRLVARSPERGAAALAAAAAPLHRKVDKGSLDAGRLAEATARIHCTTDLAAALDGADLVIESVAEERATKLELFSRVGELAAPTAIVASNSSTMPSSLFADRLPEPGRLLNLHFFNPALAMPLVEVVRGAHTDEAVADRCLQVCRDMGKQPILVRRECYGFIVNRMLFIALQEAFTLVEEGHVSMDDCDLAVRQALRWRLGPFELTDLVGLDVTHAILTEGFAQTGDPRWSPRPALAERVARGELGRKTGKGFRVA